jgi:hypothetical protein
MLIYKVYITPNNPDERYLEPAVLAVGMFGATDAVGVDGAVQPVRVVDQADD